MNKTTIKTKSIKQKNAQRNVARSLRELMKLPYRIELMPLSEKDGGGYFASIPLLKGCQSDGVTPDEAIDSLREAEYAWFRSALKHGDPIPLPQ